MDDKTLVRSGPLLMKLARKCTEDPDIHPQYNREHPAGEVVEIRLKAGGPVFKALSSEFKEAIRRVKKYSS